MFYTPAQENSENLQLTRAKNTHNTLQHEAETFAARRGLLHPIALMHEDYQCLKVQEVPN